MSYTMHQLSRIQYLRGILNELQLSEAHLTIILNENPSRALPYHNSHHLLTVAIASYENGVANHIPTTDLRCLVIAALYHDWDHTGGKGLDKINIARATTFLKNNLKQIEPTFSKKEISKVLSLVMSSEYPHRKPASNLLEGILRDSDLSQYLEPDSEDFIKGIGEELDFYSDLKASIAFIRQQTYYTDFAVARINSWIEKNS